MIVCVAGASGAVGAPTVELLRRAGHRVVALTRRDDAEVLLGRERPDVVVDLVTDLGDSFRTLTLGRAYARDRRTREAVTTSLLAAAERCGARRFVTQTVAFTTRPGTSPEVPADEGCGLLDRPPRPLTTLVGTQRLVERAAAQTAVPEATVLRFGYLYGDGTWWAPDGAYTAAVRRGRFPLIGRGSGHWPWLHVEDAAAAVLAAVTAGATGVYNVAEPGCPATRDWLPALSRALGAPPPRRVPAWAAAAAGAGAAAYLCDRAPRVSSEKARRDLGWTAAHSWEADLSDLAC